jgi:RNA polymerase sigma-70 factor, ECF subfamily
MSEIVLDFQKIYTDFRPKIQHYLTRLVGAYEAEDLTQEVFVRINQALPTFRGESQVSTWIYRIATNAALDKLRAPSFKQIAPTGPLNNADLGELEVEDRDIKGEAAPSVEQQLCHQERVECYQNFIESLPINYRAVVALSELEGLVANEIAEILGLSLDVVKVRLHRGRVRLLQALKAHCKAEDWL